MCGDGFCPDKRQSNIYSPDPATCTAQPTVISPKCVMENQIFSLFGFWFFKLWKVLGVRVNTEEEEGKKKGLGLAMRSR